MAKTTKLRKATCKICGKTFRRQTGAELIKAINAHYWKVHSAAMKRKIKRGLKRSKKTMSTSQVLVDTAGNSFWNPSWIGFAERPLIEKVTGMKYEDVKSKVLDFFVQMLLGGVKKPSS